MANIKISELSPLLTVQDADVIPIVDNAVTKKVTAAILRSYTEGNSVLLTGAQTVAGIKTFTSQLASSVATGTAPFSVASTTKVTNLNADLLDGLSSADFQAPLSGTGIVKSTAGTISYLTDNSTNWNTAYNDSIVSAAVTGSGTNTLTLTQQDAGTITATWVNGTLIREIRNNTGATLTKGTIVYISGATGNKPTVSKAIATGDSTSAQTFGFVQENILNNANGYVVVIGDLTGVDTSAFAEGAQLYLSATTAGTFTDVKQYAPNHLVYVGIVTRAHPTLGQIEVNIQNGYELDELHNVAAQSPSNGDILQYVTSTGLWTKIGGTTSAISEGSNLYFTNARSRSAISLTTTGTSGAATYNSTTGVLNVPNYADTDTGITSLNGLTALTQTFAVGTSGTDFGISSATSTHTFNLPTASATNRGALSSADWTTFNNKQNALTNPITGTGTTNYLPKFTGASALGNSIISESGSAISIAGNLGVSATISSWISQYKAIDIGLGGFLYSRSDNDETSVGTNWYRDGSAAFLYKNNGFASMYTQGSGQHTWYNAPSGTAGNAVTFTQAMTLDASGQLGIGTSSPAYKLDVNGTARVSGQVVSNTQFNVAGTPTANSGDLVNIRDLSATGSNTTFGGVFFNSSPGNDFSIGKLSENSVGYFQIRNGNNGSELLRIAASGAATFSAGVAISGATAPSSGIEFPSTQVASASANNLDDYEEGTWTMGISFGDASVGITYGNNTGNYTKVGRQVTVTGYLNMLNKGSSTGIAKITGLPFTIANFTPNYSSVSLRLDNITFAGQFQGFGAVNTNNINLENISILGTISAITDANFANTSAVIVSLTYFV